VVLLEAIFVAIALLFGYLNGFHDSANVVATAITSKSMSPRLALGMTALANLVGPFLFGVAVATTIGSEIIAQPAMTIPVAMAGLVSAITWNLLTWLLGIPSSSSHALFGGFIGAAIAGFGVGVIQINGLFKILAALLISPLLGSGFGWLSLKLVLWAVRDRGPRVNDVFLRGQWLTAAALGLSTGALEAQKTMGILTLGLVAFGILAEFHVPFWVVAASAGAIALGTISGGWRLIKAMGAGFYRVRPVHAFASQLASTGVILGATLLGGPVSTTQVISSTIVGAGAAERLKMVRWGVARSIATAWLLTLPATGLLGGVGYWLLHRFW
jgi:inorganic phosphate transporter, PiT family